jgi:hypothetical protein
MVENTNVVAPAAGETKEGNKNVKWDFWQL